MFKTGCPVLFLALLEKSVVYHVIAHLCHDTGSLLFCLPQLLKRALEGGENVPNKAP